MAGRSEADKADEEIATLRRFIKRSGLPLDPSSIEKRVNSEPDPHTAEFFPGAALATLIASISTEGVAPRMQIVL